MYISCRNQRLPIHLASLPPPLFLSDCGMIKASSSSYRCIWPVAASQLPQLPLLPLLPLMGADERASSSVHFTSIVTCRCSASLFIVHSPQSPLSPSHPSCRNCQCGKQIAVADPAGIPPCPLPAARSSQLEARRVANC